MRRKAATGFVCRLLRKTRYWFRHTGAIEIYKRTGSLTVLQQAVGHASLAVSLGYLRNLEVPMLRVEDMPRLQVAAEKC